ncbi:MAG: hypothetical protein HZA50_05480 [Planctomycetes bacterium]|nr:hypothetical protein [Planctomycetota bacterium]
MIIPKNPEKIAWFVLQLHFMIYPTVTMNHGIKTASRIYTGEKLQQHPRIDMLGFKTTRRRTTHKAPAVKRGTFQLHIRFNKREKLSGRKFVHTPGKCV